MTIVYKISILSLFFLILFIPGLCISDVSVPQMPAEFYGSVYIDEIPAPAGTMVSTLLDGVLVHEFEVTEPGVIGGVGIFDERISVIVADPFAANSIRFLVNGIDAGVTYEFFPGVSEKIDLFVAGLKTFETPPVTIPVPIYTPVFTPTLVAIPAPTPPPPFFMPPDPLYNAPYYEEPYPFQDPIIDDIHRIDEFQNERVFFSDDDLAQLILYAGSQIKIAGGSNVQQATLRRTNLSDIPAPAGFAHADYGYEILPYELSFIPDAVLIISVDEMILSQNPIIMRYDTGSDLWLQIPSLTDRFAGVIRASLTDSGMYAVFVQDFVSITPEVTVPLTSPQTPPVTKLQTQAPTQEITVTKPRVSVTPPLHPTVTPLPTSVALQHSFPPSEGRYVIGIIVLIFIFNIIVWVIYKRVRRDKSKLKRL